jgi:CHAD domain-containing protein
MLTRALPAATKGDPSALHQARVASRRMRAALPLVSTDAKAKKVGRQMRQITRALGPVRELDVVCQMLDEYGAAGKASRQAVAKLRQAVMRERNDRREDMVRLIERYDLEKLEKRALSAARKAAKGSKKDRRQRIAGARARAAARAAQLESAIDAAAGIYLPDRLHVVRIAVKKLRYAAEVVRELTRSRATAHIRALRHVQDLLGRMHDLEVLIARTRAIQSSPDMPSLKVSAELDRFVRAAENECRQLHGHYMASRDSVLRVCRGVIDDAEEAAASSAA